MLRTGVGVLSATLTLCRDFCLERVFVRAKSVGVVPLPSCRRAAGAGCVSGSILGAARGAGGLAAGPVSLGTVEFQLLPNFCEAALKHEAEEKVWVLYLSGFCICLGFLFAWIIYLWLAGPRARSRDSVSGGAQWQPGQCHRAHPWQQSDSSSSPLGLRGPAVSPGVTAAGSGAGGSPGRAGDGGSRGAAAVAGSSGPAPHTALLFSP